MRGGLQTGPQGWETEGSGYRNPEADSSEDELFMGLE